MRFLRDLRDKNLIGQTCLLRTDFNVENTKDALRLEAVLPTIKFLLKKKARIIILSHKGRPNGRESALSLKPFLPFLQRHLNRKVIFLEDIPDKIDQSQSTVYLLENLRFWPEEEKNDANFAKHLARLGNFYVNEAFAVSHRQNASLTQLPNFLPSYAGFLLEKEIATLTNVMKRPRKPLVLIFGGSKMADKMPVIKHLLAKTAKVLLGSSILNDPNLLLKSEKIMLPVDWLMENNLAMDIGPITTEAYIAEIKKAKTIIWNGPLGKFEDKRYRKSSIEIAKTVAQSKAFSIVGGGETAQLILQLGLRNKIGFLSTGGGAMLEFLAGKKLPGIEALK